MAAAGAPPSPAAVQDVRQLLYRRMRVTLVSGRVLVGDFACLDKQGNLILANTSEAVPAPASGGNAQERAMGLVLVPIAQQQAVEVQATVDEHLSLLRLVESQAAGASSSTA